MRAAIDGIFVLEVGIVGRFSSDFVHLASTRVSQSFSKLLTVLFASLSETFGALLFNKYYDFEHKFITKISN